MAKKEKTVSSVFFNGILNENPTLRLVLGICPTLASTTSASNAVAWALRQRSFWSAQTWSYPF